MPDIHSIRKPLLRHFRRKRLRTFFDLFEISPDSRVLDIGGTPSFWDLCVQVGVRIPNVVTVNLDLACLPAVMADARELPFRDQSFDVGFCNSLIEHIPSQDRRLVASEIQRTCRQYFVQTPAQEFWFEPHFVAPFIHWLPERLRRIYGRVTPWALLEKPCKADYDAMCRMELLNRTALKAHFPDGQILRERFLLWTKSLLAIKRDRPRLSGNAQM